LVCHGVRDVENLPFDEVARDSTFGPTLRRERTQLQNTFNKQGRGFFKPRPCGDRVCRPLMQDKVRCFGHHARRHHRLKLGPLLKMLHTVKPMGKPDALSTQRVAFASDSEALAAFGAACVDDGTATTGFHANQKAVGTGTAGF